MANTINTSGGRTLIAYRRGDRVVYTYPWGERRKDYVWSTAPGVATMAQGWRLWYLRLLFNPCRRLVFTVRRLPRFAIDLAAFLWDGVEWRDAVKLAWTSSGFQNV